MIPYINFVDRINNESAKKLMVLCSELWNKQKCNSITILFSSEGGFINPGINLYNFFRAFPCEIIMHNMSNIDSSALIAFLGGKQRFASPSSSFLLHGITWSYLAAQNRTKEQLEEDLSRLKEGENSIAKILSANTVLEMDVVKKLFRQGEAKSPEFALEKGIIQQIIDPKISKDGQIFNI